MPSTLPSSGGMANLLLEPQHLGLHGPCPQTYNFSSDSSSVPGTSKSWLIRSPATNHPSRRSSSNMQQCWINCAITNRPSRIGPLPFRPHAAASTGHPSNRQPLILLIHTGSWQDLGSHPLSSQQGLPVQEGIPQPASTWSPAMDQAKWFAVHTEAGYSGPESTPLVRTFQPRHVSHHQVHHLSIPSHL